MVKTKRLEQQKEGLDLLRRHRDRIRRLGSDLRGCFSLDLQWIEQEIANYEDLIKRAESGVPSIDCV